MTNSDATPPPADRQAEPPPRDDRYWHRKPHQLHVPAGVILCTDCSHCVVWQSRSKATPIVHGCVLIAEDVSPVDGAPLKTCRTRRATGGDCGPTAKLFEMRPYTYAPAPPPGSPNDTHGADRPRRRVPFVLVILLFLALFFIVRDLFVMLVGGTP